MMIESMLLLENSEEAERTVVHLCSVGSRNIATEGQDKRKNKKHRKDIFQAKLYTPGV
jgi:hypothetical protein